MGNYKTNTERNNFTDALLNEVKVLLFRKLPLRATASSLGFSEEDLRKWPKKATGVTCLGRFRGVFISEQEREIVRHCRGLDHRFYGLTVKFLRIIRQAFARVATLEVANADFRSTGIYSVEKTVFSEIDFLPIEVTEQVFDPLNLMMHNKNKEQHLQLYHRQYCPSRRQFVEDVGTNSSATTVPIPITPTLSPPPASVTEQQHTPSANIISAPTLKIARKKNRKRICITLLLMMCGRTKVGLTSSNVAGSNVPSQDVTICAHCGGQAKVKPDDNNTALSQDMDNLRIAWRQVFVVPKQKMNPKRNDWSATGLNLKNHATAAGPLG
ncbi:hypothetical protein ILUMI_05638 [Ignelater luminosus]|uniref:Uncharacterized protein n=1 Tax=Ignelater luminosus TaxID=2038154 RepID=A0A8K0D6X2_IGNLU|nr:hypothetical protein ILUMI_05638 [Ignelater luminosus]